MENSRVSGVVACLQEIPREVSWRPEANSGAPETVRPRMSKAERRRVVVEWNDTRVDYPAGRQHRLKFEDLVGSPGPTLQGLCQALDVEFDLRMLQPYEDSKKKMTDGVHPLSQQVGDHNFQKHWEIKAEVAESWREKYTEDFLGEETWRVARILGYQNPFEKPMKNLQSIALNPIAMVSREARRVKRTTV